jgi:hypothetical protein
MAIYKKIGPGFYLSVALILTAFVLVRSPFVRAIDYANAGNAGTYWNDCARYVAQGPDATEDPSDPIGGPGNCNFNDSEGKFTYDGANKSAILAATFNPACDSGPNTQLPPTMSITGANNNKPPLASLSYEMLTINGGKLTSGGYPGDYPSINYVAYQPGGDSKLTFLAKINDDGSLKILALIQNEIHDKKSGMFGKPGYVYAWSIDQTPGASGEACALDTSKPWMVVTGPKDGATVKGKKVVISFKANLPAGIGSTPTLKVGDKNLPTLSYSPTKKISYSTTWDSTTVSDGTYDITATVKDRDGKTLSDTISIKTNNGIAGDSNKGDPCYAQDTGVEWILCPGLAIANSASHALMGAFTHQLPFTMSQLVNNKNNPNNNNLHDAWAGIRDLASAFLVVIMLIMIFSQAISFGPFDAYTLRKLLPKMVVAIILMQFSWVFLGWVVNSVNYIGHGISALLYAPFGGTDVLDSQDTLWNLLHNAGIGTTATMILGGWPVLIAGLAIGIAALPMVLVGALGAVIAFLVGIAALIFRKTLIMICILFAPLALLIWILPGSSMQKYFKTWSDNFTKALMMYPLIMILIASGRIFAWVSGKQDSEMIAFIMVLVGYFGPLFLLPKTYKWGGSAMQLAGNAISKAGTKTSGALAKPAATMGKRAQGNLANRFSSTLDHELDRDKDGNIIPLSRRQRYTGLAKRSGAQMLLGHSPFRRGTLGTLAQGAEYQEELVKGKQAQIQNDYLEARAKFNDVGKAKEFIKDKYGFGNNTQGKDGKWKEKDKYTARAFNNWMVDTSSGMEIGDRSWRTDKNHPGLDLVRTQGFIDMMHGDTNRYRWVQQKFPQLAPFNGPIGGGPNWERLTAKDDNGEYKEHVKLADGTDVPYEGLTYQNDMKKEPPEEMAKKIEGLGTGESLFHPDIRKKDYQLTATDRKAGDPISGAMKEAFTEDKRFERVLRKIKSAGDMAEWDPSVFEEMAVYAGQVEKAGYQSKAKTALDDVMKTEAAKPPSARHDVSRMFGGEQSSGRFINEMMGGAYMDRVLGLHREGAAGGGASPPPTTPVGHPPGPRPHAERSFDDSRPSDTRGEHSYASGGMEEISSRAITIPHPSPTDQGAISTTNSEQGAPLPTPAPTEEFVGGSAPSFPAQSSGSSPRPTVRTIPAEGTRLISNAPAGTETRRSGSASRSTTPPPVMSGGSQRTAEQVIREQQREETEREMADQLGRQREKERRKIAGFNPESSASTGELDIDHESTPPTPGTEIKPNKPPS